MTLLEFERRFPDDASCRAYLTAIRWPNGIECPRCGTGKGSGIRRNLWRCSTCGYETSVMAGTIFQDSKLPLTLWFRAMWQVVSQKNGLSAMSLQSILGLGSYRTAWLMLHKLRAAMVRPERERLCKVVEVDETYYGAPEDGVSGRGTEKKALIAIAAEVRPGNAIGRIRLCHIPDVKRETLHGFIGRTIEPGSTVITDGLQAYRDLSGYTHQRHLRKHLPEEPDILLPRVHRVASLLKRWLLGTHQGAVSHEYLDG